jgi:hypothetical protein
MRTLRFVLLAAATTLVACAAQAPVTPAPQIAKSEPAPAVPAAPAVAAAPAAGSAAVAQSEVVYHKGYKRVMIHGEVRFCETDPTTGSRLTPSHQLCLTEDQVEMRERAAQQSTQQAQTGGATGVKTTP